MKAKKDDDSKLANIAPALAPEPEVNARQTMLQGKRTSKKARKLLLKLSGNSRNTLRTLPMTRPRTTEAVYNVLLPKSS